MARSAWRFVQELDSIPCRIALGLLLGGALGCTGPDGVLEGGAPDRSGTSASIDAPPYPGPGGESSGQGSGGPSENQSAQGAQDTRPACAVTLFSEPGFKGKAACLTKGEFDTAQLVALGYGDNSAASVKVTPGYRLTLFADAGLKGRILIRLSDDPSLSSFAFAGVVSSARVEQLDWKLTPRCPAQIVPALGKLVHPGGQVGPEQLAELWSDAVMEIPVRKAAVSAAKQAVAKYRQSAPAWSPRWDPSQSAWRMAEAGQQIFALTLLFEATCDESYAKEAADLAARWASLEGIDNWDSAGEWSVAWGVIPLITGVELLSRTWAGWDPKVSQRMLAMLEKLAVPAFQAFWKRFPGAYANRNNRFPTVAQAWMLFGILADDPARFTESITEARRILDGLPISQGGTQTNDALFVHDQALLLSRADRATSIEVCRDAWHPQVGLHATIGLAEAAWHQGVDIYSQLDNLLLAAVELHSWAYNHRDDVTFTVYHLGGQEGNSTGVTYPFKGKCHYPRSMSSGGTESWKLVVGSYELAYRHYVGRQGLKMPETEELLSSTRPHNARESWGWDTLTHSR